MLNIHKDGFNYPVVHLEGSSDNDGGYLEVMKPFF